MAQQMIDEAGNIWNVDANGNPVSFAGRAGAQSSGPVTVGRPDPGAAYEGPLAAAQLAKAQAELADRNKPPEGYRRTANGNLEPIPGGPADPKNKGRSGEEAGRDEQRLSNLRALERQIAEVRRLYAAGPGATSGLTGLRDFLPSDANREFDTAAAALADIGNAAFKVPGAGVQTDADAARFVAANQPSAADRDVQIEQKLNALERRLGEAYRAMSVEPLGLLPSLAPKALDRTIAGEDKFTSSPEGSELATQLVRMGRTDEQINAALTAAGLDPVDVRSIAQVREYLRQNPNFQGVIPGVGKTERTSPAEQFLSSPAGAGAMSYLDAASVGLTSQMVGQQGRDALQMNQANSPVASLVGGGLGSLTALGAGGAALRGSSLAARMAANPGRSALAGDVAYGGAFGFNTADEGQGALGAGIGAAGSAVGNFTGRGIANVAGGIARGVRNPNLDTLRSRGIPLTLGQISGARGGMLGRAISGTEEAIANSPVANFSVGPRRLEGLEAYNRAEFADAGAPIGFTPTEIGREGVQQLAEARSQAYMNSLNPTRIDMTDPQLVADLAAARAAAQTIPNVNDAQTATIAALDARINTPAANTQALTGRQFQEAYRGLSRTGRERANTDYGFETGQVMRQGQNALAGALERQNPGAYQGFLSANAANRNLNVLADAVGRAQNAEDMLFTPAQVANARRAADTRLGDRIDAATRPLRSGTGLTDAAQAVLPNRTPPTGVNAMPLLALAGGATYGAGEATDNDWVRAAAAPALLALPYTRTGRNITQAALLDRPQWLQDIGTFAVERAAPILGLFGRGAGVTTAGLLGR